MFEIYYDATYNQEYKVVYYTELNEHNKEAEIHKALAGVSIFSGYINNIGKEKSKEEIEEILYKLNSGQTISAEEIEFQLRGCLV